MPSHIAEPLSKPPFLLHPYFVDYILPFVLVFTLIFAVLQKTKLLGDDSKQINVIVGLVVGLILIAFPGPRDIIVLLMPFLAVAVVILLVFMLLYGFIGGKKDEEVLGTWWKYSLGGLLALSLLTYIIFISGNWDYVYNFFFGGGSRQVWVNIILIVVIIGAIVAVLKGENQS